MMKTTLRQMTMPVTEPMLMIITMCIAMVLPGIYYDDAADEGHDAGDKRCCCFSLPLLLQRVLVVMVLAVGVYRGREEGGLQ